MNPGEDAAAESRATAAPGVRRATPDNLAQPTNAIPITPTPPEPRARVIDGVVIGMSGHDGEVRVRLRRRTKRLALRPEAIEIVTCDDRRFRITISPDLRVGGGVALQASTADETGESHWVDVADEPEAEHGRAIVLELRPVRRVRARAVDAAGSAVALAEWMVWSFPERVSRWDAATSEGERQFVLSGSDGTVEFRAREGRLVVFARTTGGAFGEPRRVEFGSLPGMDLGDVAVGPPLTEFIVCVTDDAGKPVRGAGVLIPVEDRCQRYAGADAGPRPYEAAQETDEFGKVTLRAARLGRPLTVAVCAEGFLPAAGSFDRADLRNREFRLRPSPALQVRFRAGGGFVPVPEDIQVEPAPGAGMRFDVHPDVAGALHDDAAALVRDLLAFHGRFRGEALGDGVFSGHLQHSGRWRISARFPAGLVWERDFDAADGATTELAVDLPPGRPVMIPLPANADERQARREHNIRVQLSRTLRRASSEAVVGDRWSTTNSVLRLADLPEDGRAPALWAPDSCEDLTVLWSRRGGWLGRASVRIAPGPGAELALPLSEILAPAPAPCRLRVRAALERVGVPLPSVQVSATAVADTREEVLGERTRAGASGLTDAEGLVDLVLAPGRYQVRISPASGPGRPVEVDVRDPERATEATVWMPLQPR